jgi:hypothetical protein
MVMKLYYRGMRESNGKPKVGRSARLLGVRPEVDIDVVLVPESRLDKMGDLNNFPEQKTEVETVAVVIRNTKGMSTALSIEGLPLFRKPKAFGGIGQDPLWQIEDYHIMGDIEAVQDGETHVSILPRRTMLLARYEAALAATQDFWELV